MVDHLRDIVGKILKIVRVGPQDIVLDIGSNDGTLLKAYPQGKARRVGMDASGNKFKKYYPSDIELVSAFFSAVEFKKHFGVQKAKVVRRYFDRISLGPFYMWA